ncbi:hypothetical protein V5R04_15005 [Jonesiaceae bacterium BS-20]|uniref:Uncharacterized protein n=1 Tax=Jonesiaceae bacterium BS-20 TaxID=3120821 RepID=A0AAU7DWW5_9MICO
MALGGQPNRLASLQCGFNDAVANTQTSLECAERDHHAIGVFVERGFATGLILLFKNTYGFVFPQDLVEVRVRDNWIVGNHA